ncbi:CPBP family intramembrane glutamic endopeptidase [Sphingomonas sp.]|uniref:CPBP family intramembrane glutamic endopeptidase n=2 Tax=Sphingomonas TaxID=13687 RepID=UPI000E10CB58|nr:type II CAAX endopeptidase family protein [Sphingomonas sp.]AXJ96880.1 CPBP family intramembrane metalloprotease [Sphingomonas sp. FARSPH]
MITLGEAGVLSPGKWRWLRTLGWMVLLFAVSSVLLYPGWLRLPGIGRDAIRPVMTFVAYLAYAVAVRWGERRYPDELAPRPALAELAIGLAVGTGMFALVFTILRLAGVYTLAPGRWYDWASDIAGMMRVGFAEELLLRLVVFRLLMRASGLWAALGLSAALFGLMHLGNPNASPVAAVAIAVEAGLMLAAFYLLTGRIWMAVGVHAAWNIAQGSIFGARVSGMADSGSLFVSAPVAGSADWLSGGAFGPEASVPAMVVGFCIFVLVLRAALLRSAAQVRV